MSIVLPTGTGDKTMQGIMRTAVHLLGTSLRLQKGQRVNLIPSHNLPSGDYFASPADGKWEDGIDRHPDDCILLNADDVCIVGNNHLHEDFEDERKPI